MSAEIIALKQPSRVICRECSQEYEAPNLLTAERGYCIDCYLREREYYARAWYRAVCEVYGNE